MKPRVQRPLRGAFVAFVMLVAFVLPSVATAIELRSGDLVVTDRATGHHGPPALDRIDPHAGTRVTLPAPGPSENLLRNPQDVIVSRAGEVFVADEFWILEVDPWTGEQFIVSRALGDAILVVPIGIELAPDGGLFVSDLSAFGGGGGIVHVDRETGFQTPVFVSPEGTLQTLRPSTAVLLPGGLMPRCQFISPTDETASASQRASPAHGVQREDVAFL